MSSYTLIIHHSEVLTDSDDFNRYKLRRGYSLLNNLMQQNIRIRTQCGGKAMCALCQVKVVSGQQHCNKPVAEEQYRLGSEKISQGWRLACQLYCLNDLGIYLPD